MGKLILILGTALFIGRCCSTEPIEPGGQTVAHTVADAMSVTNGEKAHEASRKLEEYYRTHGASAHRQVAAPSPVAP